MVGELAIDLLYSFCHRSTVVNSVLPGQGEWKEMQTFGRTMRL